MSGFGGKVMDVSSHRSSLVQTIKANKVMSGLIAFSVAAVIVISVLSYYLSKKESFATGGYADACTAGQPEQRTAPCAVEFIAMDQDVSNRQIDYAAMEMIPKPTPVDNVGYFNSEHANDTQQNVVNSHTEGPEMDYSAYLTDQIVGPEERAQHAKWAKDTMPWSGVARSYDTMDEAVESSMPFVGLNRPTPVAQVNPLQITEVGASSLSANRRLTY